MLLRTDSLIKSYKQNRVVDGISIEISKGEVVGLLGPNGAGKTTTFYMMVGLLRPDEGSIYLEGENITNLPMFARARRGIGYLPQEPSIFRKLTVAENILAILQTLPLSKRERLARLGSLLKELDVAHLARQRAWTLSGGERRRVEITRALVTSPSFILLDEPFTGIDPIVVSDIQQIIFELKSKGYGILITDHNVRETLEITDRAYIMHQGRILLSGTSHELVTSEKARQVYLGEDFKL
ncbi:LPS export ABC transporter ATP-binding protein [bacterium]|nr:LPS export ABC transporter ATP-binding protein [bacterium]MCK4326619.1 LPS export ABC transporter ATP-binding protein [bacterium]MCK4437155.1 LPS export ABC transporter ATP-binding protein [bacterium]